MLHVEFPNFTKEYFLDYDLNYYEKNFDLDEMLERVGRHIMPDYRGQYQFVMIVNNKPLFKPDYNCLLNFVLKRLNNGFCELLTTSESAVIIFDELFNRDTTIKISKNGNSLFLTTLADNRSLFAHGFKDEKIDLAQAVEEIIRVVKEYNKICLETAKIATPDKENEFMSIIFGKAHQQDVSWQPLEQIWKEYKEKHHIS